MVSQFLCRPRSSKNCTPSCGILAAKAITLETLGAFRRAVASLRSKSQFGCSYAGLHCFCLDILLIVSIITIYLFVFLLHRVITGVLWALRLSAWVAFNETCCVHTMGPLLEALSSVKYHLSWVNNYSNYLFRYSSHCSLVPTHFDRVFDAF